MRPRETFLVAMLLGLTSVACNSDKPKQTEESKKPTPVPSGLVFNDFVPTGAAPIRDASIDGAFGDLGGAEGDEDAVEPPGKLKIIDPGAEPRAVRRYAFVANRAEKRAVTITQSVNQTVGSQAAPAQEITLKMLMDFTPKQVKPTTQFEVKIAKFELPGAPQLASAVSAMNGLTGAFAVSPLGELGDLTFAPDARMQNQYAEVVMQSLSRTLQLLLPEFPDGPIGVGAKWESKLENTEKGAEMSRRRTFTLKEVNAEGGVIESEIEEKVPRRAQQIARGVTAFVEAEVTGKETYAFRFDRLATKVEGELTATQKQEVNDPRAGGKQTVTQVEKVKHLIEVPASSK